jgi:hypothetical protein
VVNKAQAFDTREINRNEHGPGSEETGLCIVDGATSLMRGGDPTYAPIAFNGGFNVPGQT